MEKLVSFDFLIIYQLGPLGGKPNALSRQVDYGPLKGGDALKRPNQFQFLKPYQLGNFPEHEESIATIDQLSLSAITVQPLNVDVEFACKIKVTLSKNPDISPYLTNLQDSTLPQEEDVQLYLLPYSIHDDLIFRDSLIYIPNDDKLKLQVLRSCHDSHVSSHLGQDKPLE